METSKQGIQFIAKWESFSSTSYDDGSAGGLRTIGYGHLIKGGERIKEPITEAFGEELLIRDIKSAESAINREVKVALTQGQYDALASFTFNLGGGNLQSSTLLKKLNAKDYVGAAAELAKWHNDNGKPVKGLLLRRAAEIQLFFS